MTSTSSADQQMAQGALQMADGLERTAIQGMFSPNIVCGLCRDAQCIFATRVIATVVQILTEGNGRPTMGDISPRWI